MAAGSRTHGCRKARQNGKLMPAKWERTAFAFWKHWRHLMPPNSSPTSRRSRSSGRCGRGTLSPAQRATAGPLESVALDCARSAGLVAARISSSHPTMWRRAFAPSARWHLGSSGTVNLGKAAPARFGGSAERSGSTTNPVLYRAPVFVEAHSVPARNELDKLLDLAMASKPYPFRFVQNQTGTVVLIGYMRVSTA